MSANLIQEIKKLKVAATYGKKRHYNAADRKRKSHNILTYSALLLSIFTGSVLFGVLKDYCWEHLPAVFALASAFLLGTEEFFKFGKHSVEHQSIAGRYLNFARECAGLIALHNNGLLSEKELAQKFGELQKSLTEIDTSGALYPTDNDDYEKSREGIKDGEEKFTSQEMDDVE